MILLWNSGVSCTICCKWHMISNLRSSEWLLRTGALQRQLQVFTEMIQERLFLVVIRSSSQYYTCQLFLSQMREIFALSWPRFAETSRRLPKISDEFPKTYERCRKLDVHRLFPKTSCVENTLSGFVTQAWEPVADPDLQVRWKRGRGSSRPRDKESGGGF